MQRLDYLRILLAVALVYVGTCTLDGPSFDSAALVLSDNKPNTPFDFNITFRPTRDVGYNEIIVVRLPRFTRGLYENSTAQNETFGNVMIAPSYFFIAKWVSGYNSYDDDLIPYHTAELHIMPLYNVTCIKQSTYTITVFKENGIGAVCGFPSSDIVNSTGMFVYPFKQFEILTALSLEAPSARPTEAPTQPTVAPTAMPSSPSAKPTPHPTRVTPTASPTIAVTSQPLFYHNDSYKFDYYTGVGKGCQALGQCTKLGQCDYCEQKCYCFDGFGSATDLVGTGRDLQPDCSSRVCPAGKAIADIPTGTHKAHALAECSNRGRCNRQSGQCQCFPPFTGAACEKMSCPNDCSGHGACLSMGELSRARALANSRRIHFEYGSSQGYSTTAWDWDVVRGCLCDSAWPVGYGDGDTQLAEYYGADCSLRRCPSGDDPYTTVDETNCQGLSQMPGDPERGYFGNKCHVECSRRGTCNPHSGTCTCFPGSWGTACEHIANAGRHSWEAGSDTPSFALAGFNDSIIIEDN